MGNHMGIVGSSPFAAQNYKSTVKSNEKGEGFEGFLQSKMQPEEEPDYRKQLQEKMAEMLENIKHGTIQPKFKIGAQEYTHEEWNELLEKIDEAEEDLREQLEAELEAAKEEAEEKEERQV